MLTVKLPYSIGTRDIPWLFQICKQIATSSDGQLELDGSDTEFIDPFGLSVLAAALSKANPRFISMPWLKRMLRVTCNE